MSVTLPIVGDPKRDTYTLKESDFLALRALATGYHRIDFRDGLRLIFLGLADVHKDGGCHLTDAGRKLLEVTSP